MLILGVCLSGLIMVGGMLVKSIHPMGLVLGYASNINVSQVVAETNQERQLAGLPALVFNQELALAAQAKANDMFINQYWSHISTAGKEPWDFIEEAGYRYQVAGENLARDFTNTVQMVEAWMLSPTHRANILNPRYQEIGVAVIDGELGGVETTLVVQMFGAKNIAPAVLVEAPESKVRESDSQQLVWQVYNENQEEVQQELLPSENQSPMILAGQDLKSRRVSAQFSYSPNQVVKAVFLSLLLVLIFTLAYDMYAVGHHQTSRTVGKNLAHIAFLGLIAFVIILYKSGSIG